MNARNLESPMSRFAGRVPQRLALAALALACVSGFGSTTALADGRIVVVGPPNQGPVQLGPNDRVTPGPTKVINGVPTTIVRIEPMPAKPKFVIGLPLLFPPGVMMYFPFPADHDEGGVHVSHEVWVNSPGGGQPDNFQVVSVSCIPGGAQCVGCKVAFPPGAILIPDPPQPAGLKFMVDRYPADPATESQVLASLALPNNPWPEVWILTTGDFYFFTDNNQPGPPVQMRPAAQPGDLNCDDAVNGLDIQDFVQAVLAPTAYQQSHASCGYFYADVNADRVVDVQDVATFVAILTAE